MIKKSKEDIHYKKNKANKKTKSNNVSARNKNNELFDFDKSDYIKSKVNIDVATAIRLRRESKED